MFYFIPAWYPQERPWYDTTCPWYRAGGEEFDDTINQLRMFESNQEKTRLLLLNYRPHLRYVLHRYDLLETDYWSLFDSIQSIGSPQQLQIDFRELDWPTGVEFVYTPFLASVYHGQHLLAHAEFGQDGQLIWIDYLKEEVLKKRYVFDDRGFVSSIIVYQDGQPYYQDYLNPLGVCQFREYLLPDRTEVLIQEEASYAFHKVRYTSMAEVVEEALVTYLQEDKQESACMIVAAHPQHNELLNRAKGSRKLVLSSYSPREERFPSLEQAAQSSDVVIVDRVKTQNQLRQDLGVDALHLSLFDTRLSLGKSQRLKELIVYLLVDQLASDVLESYLAILFEAMEKHQNMVLHLVTYERDKAKRESFEAYLNTLLEGQEASYLFLEKEDKMAMFELLEEEAVPSRVSFLYLDSEMAILRALEQTRLVIDVREEADLYTQIAAISAGIPQINRQDSEFVEHLKNGYKLDSAADLHDALDYYLTGLRNWNQALVYAVQKIEEYTSGRLVERLVDKIRENDT